MTAFLEACCPRFALDAFRDEYLRARVAQHRVRVRFPGAVSRHVPQRCDDVSRRADAQGVAPLSTATRQVRGQR